MSKPLVQSILMMILIGYAGIRAFYDYRQRKYGWAIASAIFCAVGALTVMIPDPQYEVTIHRAYD